MGGKRGEHILVELQAVDAISVPVEIHRPSLALFPALVQFRLHPVDLLPVVGRLHTGHTQTCAWLYGPASGVSGGLFPQERLAPDVLVPDHLGPARRHPAGRVQGRRIEKRKNLNCELRGQLRDEVDFDDGRLVEAETGSDIHVRVQIVAGDVGVHFGARKSNPNPAFMVIQRVFGEPSRTRERVVHNIVAVQSIAGNRRRVSRCGPGITRDDRWLLAGAGDGERWGFDRAEVVLE